MNDMIRPRDVHSRTIRCAITGIDSKEGVATLSYYGFPSSGRQASLPWLWCSFSNESKTRGTWGRYVPFNGDFVKVSFDYDDTPHILGYDALAPSKIFQKDSKKEGWGAITEANKTTQPLFRPLKSGEYDFKSVGGAYIYGAEDGHLYLASGLSTISLNDNTKSIEYESYLHKFTSFSSYLRLGQVRRTLPPSVVDAPLSPTTSPVLPPTPWNPLCNGSEFNLHISNPVAGIDIPFVDFSLGNVATDVFIDLSSNGLPKASSLKIYDPTGKLVQYNSNIDIIGNTSTVSNVALSYSISMPIASHSTTFMSSDEIVVLDKTITSSGGGITITGIKPIEAISATSVNLKAPKVNIGAIPAGGVLNGDIMSAALAVTMPIARSAIVSAGAAPPVAPLANAVALAFDAIVAAIQASTSKTVTVSP